MQIYRIEFYKSKFIGKAKPKSKIEYNKGACGCHLLHFYKWGITFLGTECYKKLKTC